MKIIIFMVLLMAPVYSQNNINNTQDKKNKSEVVKNGFFIEKEGVNLIEAYYKNGKYHGVYRSYQNTPQILSCFGEYNNGEPCGTWYIFGPKGHLEFKETKLGKNKDLITTVWENKRLKLPYKSYIIKYHENGNIESEGLVLWDESVEIDSYEVGLWKYYDENGKLKETKTFK